MSAIDPSGWIADKGYVVRGMITPHKKPPNGELSEAAKEANKSINKIRQVVEQTIAHIKAWRIHPHRLPPPPAHIRADHHRRTLTPRLQNHRLNKLRCSIAKIQRDDFRSRYLNFFEVTKDSNASQVSSKKALCLLLMEFLPSFQTFSMGFLSGL